MSEKIAAGRENGTSQNKILPDIIIDLRSDTFSKPGKEMRKTIANAVVGDDVEREDPTTNEFERKVAELLGKEAALFVTSGTQGNLICNLIHCNVRGSELIVGNATHIFLHEQGNYSQYGGIHSCQIENKPDGTFSIEKLKELIREDDVHYAITKLVCVENTNCYFGGRALPLKWLDELADVCKERNIPIHMDGARLFNAVVATGIPAKRYVRDMASVSFCLSKGLGCPVGSVIAGSRAFIEQARRMRKALGSGLRQNGILTAAGMYSLDNMIERLKEDHDNAKRIMEIINEKGEKNVWVDPELVQTNMVILNVNKAIPIQEFCEKLELVEDEVEERALFGKSVSVKCYPWSAASARLVTYVGISKEMAEMGALKICYVAQRLAKIATTA